VFSLIAHRLTGEGTVAKAPARAKVGG
jgi:hypothetical protein